MLLALILAAAGCSVIGNAGRETSLVPPVADLLLTTGDLEQLRPALWTEADQPPEMAELDGGVCGEECVAALWSAPGGDLALTLNRHATAAAASTVYEQAVSVASHDLGYEPTPLPSDVQFPANTWLGTKSGDSPLALYLFSQRGQYLVVILMATTYEAVTDEQLQGFEVILSDVASIQVAKLPAGT